MRYPFRFYLQRFALLECNNGFALLECKDYVKFLGVLIDKNLTWRPHIDHIASKISKIVGIIARLRHHVPLNTLLQIYRSLIFPYTLYGIPVWGQASQCDLKKILTLQKRALPAKDPMPSLFLLLPTSCLLICFTLKRSPP